MSKRTTHLFAAAVGLMLSVPAAAQGQEVSESRQLPAVATATPSPGKSSASARPRATLDSAVRADVKPAPRASAARNVRIAERFRKQRPQH